MNGDRQRRQHVTKAWQRLVEGSAGSDASGGRQSTVEECASYLVQLIAFCLAAERNGDGSPLSRDGASSWENWLAMLAGRFGPGLIEWPTAAASVSFSPQAIASVRDALARFAWRAEDLGPLHEFLLSRSPSASMGTDGQRRKQGSFYTPDEVVRYIVDKVVATADRPGCILDPACGGGAFLLGLYRALTLSGKNATGALAALEGIRGIDADPLAVMAARRTLWLAAACDVCHEETLTRRCGEIVTQNILVGNFLTGEEGSCFDGQVDAIVGNPPYRRELNTRSELMRVADTEFGRRYRRPRMDLWYYFVHRGLELLRPGGRMSLIVNAYWTRSTGASRLIESLREECQVEEIFDLGTLRVFPGVAGRHLILTATKGPGCEPTTVKRLTQQTRTADLEACLAGRSEVAAYRKTHDAVFADGLVDVEPPVPVVAAGDVPTVPLSDLGMVRQGIAENPATVTRRALAAHGGDWTVGEGIFVLTAEELAALDLPERERRLVQPYHDLCDLGRYCVAGRPSKFLIESTMHTCPDIGAFPAIGRHLARFRPIMEARRETCRGTRPWWQLHWPRDPLLWRSRKLVVPQMVRQPVIAVAGESVRVSFSVNVFVPSAETPEHLNYLAAVLNSRRLAGWFARHAKQRGVGLEINGHVLANAPIRRIDFTDAREAEVHRRIVELVERRARWLPPPDRPAASENNVVLDEEIDLLVERLYS